MRVKELIEALSKIDPETIVMTGYEGFFEPLKLEDIRIGYDLVHYRAVADWKKYVSTYESWWPKNKLVHIKPKEILGVYSGIVFPVHECEEAFPEFLKDKI